MSHPRAQTSESFIKTLVVDKVRRIMFHFFFSLNMGIYAKFLLGVKVQKEFSSVDEFVCFLLSCGSKCFSLQLSCQKIN